MSHDPNTFNNPSAPPGDYQSYQLEPPDAYQSYPPPQAGGSSPQAAESPPQANNGTVTDGWGDFSSLDGKEIRRVFVRNVYAILMIQLLVGFGIIALFSFTPSIRTFVRSSSGLWLYLALIIAFIVICISLVCCCQCASQQFPANLIIFGMGTLLMSYMMGMVSAFYETDSVLIAVGITAFVCLGVTIFSFQTKYDFTSCCGVLFVISIALLGFSIAVIFTRSHVVYTIYAGLGAVFFSIYLAVDTQLIMGGKRQEISGEDHIAAAYILYTDIVNIFIFMLELLGKRQ
ncbi:unnamed protein product [Adineta steineri]|uniref:Uncharacterized protein n=1 Tax=Adineta steineri TaxID=433720 RepID=A0A815QR01_9BILA|nr:unnamed protein product [Adineta steineri]CAF1634308.1 unnamed protein product [Adineta steineri]